MRTTYIAKPAEVEREWFLVDANGLTLGRLAAQVAAILRGKHKPIFTPHVDTGDHVIIINADKVRLTGKKMDQKIYRHHTGYMGGLKETPVRVLLAKKPEEVVYRAIKGMLPKNVIGRQMIRKLRVYAGPEHSHSAQNPKPLKLDC